MKIRITFDVDVPYYASDELLRMAASYGGGAIERHVEESVEGAIATVQREEIVHVETGRTIGSWR